MRLIQLWTRPTRVPMQVSRLLGVPAKNDACFLHSVVECARGCFFRADIRRDSRPISWLESVGTAGSSTDCNRVWKRGWSWSLTVDDLGTQQKESVDCGAVCLCLRVGGNLWTQFAGS